MTARPFDVITALAPLPHPRFSQLLRPDQAGPRLRHLRAGLRHHRLLVLGGDPGRLDRSDPRPAAARFLRAATRCATAPTSRRSPCRSTTTSITRAASSPGSTISPASGRSATISIRRSISTSSKSASAICARWKILETPSRLETVQRIIGFQRRLVDSGAFADPRSHIYYLPELYCAYFGRCYAAFMRAAARPRSAAIDPDGTFEFIRGRVLAYVAGRTDRARDEPVRRRAGADRARPSRRRAATLRAGAALHRRTSSAKAAGMGRSRPMSGTR